MSARSIVHVSVVFMSLHLFSVYGSQVPQTGIREAPAVLFPILAAGKVGFIDASGKVVIAPRFEGARAFREGLAPVSSGGKFGYIDARGAFVIQPLYDRANSFSEGLAAVMLGGKWGYIDKSGKVVVPLQFRACGPFSGGLAVALKGAVTSAMPAGVTFDEGTESITHGTNCGYINRTGVFAIPPKFNCAVYLQYTKNTYVVLQILSPDDFSGGLAAVDVDGKWGYINAKGTLVIPARFGGESHVPNRFREGLAAVLVGDRWGYIDKSGTPVIKPQFEQAKPFSEGLALVLSRDKGGYIDTQGRFVIPPKYEDARAFSEGLAGVAVDGKWGFIDKKGNVVIQPQFEEAESFENGLAQVFPDRNTMAYINRAGKVIWRSSEAESKPGGAPAP